MNLDVNTCIKDIKRPNMSKFTELTATDNKSILQKSTCFVQKDFALRNEFLYTQA